MFLAGKLAGNATCGGCWRAVTALMRESCVNVGFCGGSGRMENVHRLYTMRMYAVYGLGGLRRRAVDV